MISFTVSGDPIAQPRHKISTRGGFAKAYIPKDHPIHGYKQAIQLAAKVAMAGQAPIEGPVEVAIYFRFRRPKSHTKKQRESYWHCQKPDVDNLAKAVLDALSGICFGDDAQICQISIRKKLGDMGDSAYTCIAVSAIE
jgi:crossover junction endodeoxyribonuclease RusA